MQGNTDLQQLEPRSAPFRARRLGHVNLWVSDYERAYDYYRNVLGFEHAYTQPNIKGAFVTNNNTYHDFALSDVTSHLAPAGQKTGLGHFAFELRNEVDLADGYRKAKESGAEFAWLSNFEVARSAFRADPDGNFAEVYADVVPDWRAVRSGVVHKKTHTDKQRVQAGAKYIPGETFEPVSEEFYPTKPEILIVKEALFHPKRTAHVSLITKDHEAMYDFYTGYLGLVPFFGDRSSDFVILGGTHSDGDDVVLHRPLDGVEPGLHHIGIEVIDVDKLDSAKAELAKRDIKIDSETRHPAREALTIIAMDGIRMQFFGNRDWRPELLQGLGRQEALALL
ncbi:VOC family protein [Bradyrhizobium mercantei]|uniref:VOC family protein n=1 Tax=Bradyrhizobium mercantei TaxID=1904807 RepID=UPI0009755235|nr:VOC family protein [Bradyrhizobium mercantei]